MILTKDGVEKDIRTPNVIDRLKRQGWKAAGDKAPEGKETKEELDLEALKAEATELGLEFHPRTGAAKLQALIAEHKAK